MCDGKKHDKKVSFNKSNEWFYMIIMFYFEYFCSPWGRLHFRFVCNIYISIVTNVTDCIWLSIKLLTLFLNGIKINKTTKWEAEQFVEEYTKDFFVWGKCKWIQRRKAQGHAATEVMSQTKRGHLTNQVAVDFVININIPSVFGS